MPSYQSGTGHLMTTFFNRFGATAVENYLSSWVAEHELIAQWQTAELSQSHGSHQENSPWFSTVIPETGLNKNSRELAWGLLFKLGSRTRAAFETSKLLRPKQTADEEVYALIKLSRNIENPHRNRVQGLLKSVVKSRTKMHRPRTSRRPRAF